MDILRQVAVKVAQHRTVGADAIGHPVAQHGFALRQGRLACIALRRIVCPQRRRKHGGIDDVVILADFSAFAAGDSFPDRDPLPVLQAQGLASAMVDGRGQLRMTALVFRAEHMPMEAVGNIAQLT